MHDRSDPLGVRASSQFVMSRSRSVRIDRHAASAIARQIIDYPGMPAVTTWQRDHLGSIKLSDRELANYVLVLDALNFYFWGEPRWRVSYRGESANGYWALTLALRRAMYEGYPLTDAAYLAQISSIDVAHILRGESVIPLFSSRVQHLREAGQALLREHEGQFLTCIDECDGSVPSLLRHIITLFPSFVDVQRYYGRAIPFYKRAQILVSDLSAAFESRGTELFGDLSCLTTFADYKVPQVLHQLGVLRYQSGLEMKLQNMELIPSGSAEEIEIRAATIVAVEQIAEETSRNHVELPDYAIDWYLWALGQQDDIDRLPYHRTPTAAY
jgi:hypothetical protein